MRDICFAVCSCCCSMSSSSFVSPLAYTCDVHDETHRCTSSQGVCACGPASSNTEWLQLNSNAMYLCKRQSEQKQLVLKGAAGGTRLHSNTLAFALASANCSRNDAASSSASFNLRRTSSPSWSFTLCFPSALLLSARHLPLYPEDARRTVANGLLHGRDRNNNA